MAKIRSVFPVKLFVGILTSIPEIIPKVEERLVGLFGAVDSWSVAFPFDSTHYYDETMGTPLYRYFLSFADLMDASAISDVKVKTNDMETGFASECPNLQRPLNLDPGYVEQSKIVLASTKNFYHRILISRGIYAEVTLHFEAGEWHPFPWTFPDYKTDRYHPFFISLRQLYRSQLSERGFKIRIR